MQTYARRMASVATAMAALITGAAGATVAASAYVAEQAPRTVELGIEAESSDPVEWTTRVIIDGWAATSTADRARACAATPAQLRAAAPHSTYDPARYDVETAIDVLGALCAGK